MKRQPAARVAIVSGLSGIAFAAIGSPVFAGYRLTTLASFDGTSGSSPASRLTVVGDTIYGTTSGGGQYGNGTVFSVPVAGGQPTVLTSFIGELTHGAPFSGLIYSGDTLYGTSYRNQTTSGGTVFSLPKAGGTPTVLSQLTTSAYSPRGELVLVDNTLYGGATLSSPSGRGGIYSVPLAGGVPTTIATFESTVGYSPYGGLTLFDGKLYGTTSTGDSRGHGSVFSVPLTGGTPTELALFDNASGIGASISGVTIANGVIYGESNNGGPQNAGVVFSVPITGGKPTVLANLDSASGMFPKSTLAISGNTLYGVTSSKGPGGSGTVFSLPITGGIPRVMAAFNSTNGASPLGSLTLVGNTLYGSTTSGGAGGAGTVFALSTVPNPIVSLTTTAPTDMGSQLATLTVNDANGGNVPAEAAVSGTPAGYVAVGGFGVASHTEYYALKITGSVPANLAADLLDAASELNTANYNGYALAASTTDPTGLFGSDYNLFLTMSNDTLGTGSPYFGFDFSQLNGIADTLRVTAVAVVPEPSGFGLLAAALLGFHRRRR